MKHALHKKNGSICEENYITIKNIFANSINEINSNLWETVINLGCERFSELKLRKKFRFLFTLTQ